MMSLQLRLSVSSSGEHELCCRAREAAGNEQPLEPSWNLGGYANNAVQCIPSPSDPGPQQP